MTEHSQNPHIATGSTVSRRAAIEMPDRLYVLRIRNLGPDHQSAKGAAQRGHRRGDIPGDARRPPRPIGSAEPSAREDGSQCRPT